MKNAYGKKLFNVLSLAMLIVALSLTLFACAGQDNNAKTPENGYGKWGDKINVIEAEIVYSDEAVAEFEKSIKRVNDKLSSINNEHSILDSVFLLRVLKEAKVSGDDVIRLGKVMDNYGEPIVTFYDKMITTLDFTADDLKLLRKAYIDTIEVIGNDALGYVAYHYICLSLKQAKEFYADCLAKIEREELDGFSWYSDKFSETQKEQNLNKYKKLYKDYYNYADGCLYAMAELGPTQLIVVGRVYLTLATAGVMSVEWESVEEGIEIVKEIIQSGFVVNADTIEANIVAFIKNNVDMILATKMPDSAWNAVYKIVDLYLDMIINKNGDTSLIDANDLRAVDIKLFDVIVKSFANLNFGKLVNFISDESYNLIKNISNDDLKQLLYCILTYQKGDKYYYTDKEITYEQYKEYKRDNGLAVCRILNGLSNGAKDQVEIYALDILRTAEKSFNKRLDTSTVPQGVSFKKYGFDDLWNAAKTGVDSFKLTEIVKGIIYRYAPNVARCFLRYV